MAKSVQNNISSHANTLKQASIVLTQGEVQHIQPQLGDVYELSIKDGQALSTDFALIARKVGSDLEVLLEDDTTVIFDDYFNICTPDLSCLVSLPSTEGVYYVVDGSFTTLADGSQIVHSYGDVGALSTIAKGQSSAFESSFNELFLTEQSSAFTYLPLLALGGGGGGGGSSSGGGTGGSGTGTSTAAPTQADVDRLTQELADAQAEADRLTQELADAQAEEERLTQELADAQAENVNNAPIVANAIANQLIQEDTPFSLPIANHFTDPDGDALYYVVYILRGGNEYPLPSWLEFDASTLTFSGTPLNADVGVINVEVTATDSGGLSATDIVSITVNNVNDAPTLMPISPIEFQVGQYMEFDLSVFFTDPDDDILTYILYHSIPDWLRFNQESGILYGIAELPIWQETDSFYIS